MCPVPGAVLAKPKSSFPSSSMAAMLRSVRSRNKRPSFCVGHSAAIRVGQDGRRIDQHGFDAAGRADLPDFTEQAGKRRLKFFRADRLRGSRGGGHGLVRALDVLGIEQAQIGQLLQGRDQLARMGRHVRQRAVAGRVHGGGIVAERGKFEHNPVFRGVSLQRLLQVFGAIEEGVARHADAVRVFFPVEKAVQYRGGGILLRHAEALHVGRAHQQHVDFLFRRIVARIVEPVVVDASVPIALRAAEKDA